MLDAGVEPHDEVEEAEEAVGLDPTLPPARKTIDAATAPVHEALGEGCAEPKEDRAAAASAPPPMLSRRTRNAGLLHAEKALLAPRGGRHCVGDDRPDALRLWPKNGRTWCGDSSFSSTGEGAPLALLWECVAPCSCTCSGDTR